jgi:hypothetical protein
MISITMNDHWVKRKIIYFDPSPNKWFALTNFAFFMNCHNVKKWPFLILYGVAYTKTIDLKEDEDVIFSNFSKDTQYKIRRAEREGLEFGFEKDFSTFYDFYANFTKLKSMPVASKAKMKCNFDHLFVTTVSLAGEVVCMHSYLLDPEAGRVMLLTSSSMYRNEDESAKRNLIGRANRWLHYKDMLYFKEKNFSIYDLGGYAAETTDIDLQNINKFKDNFGGKLIEENTYISFPLWFVRLIYEALKKVQRVFS